MNELDLKVEAMAQQIANIKLEVFVMHRAVLRCQARTWCLADRPRGWGAIWMGIKDLFLSKKRVQKERQELINSSSTQSMHLADQAPPVDSEKK